MTHPTDEQIHHLAVQNLGEQAAHTLTGLHRFARALLAEQARTQTHKAEDAPSESALRLALAAREGFVMVPVEPTPDMLEAGAGTKYEKRARNVWRDMIAAAAPKGTT
jgi:hypothetical protein